MGRKSKTKRAGFRGTPSYAKRAAVAASRDEPERVGVPGSSQEGDSQRSAVGPSAEKLASAPSSWARASELAEFREDDLTPFSTADAPSYRLIDLRQLSIAISSFLVCGGCKKGQVKLLENEGERKGFASMITLKCDRCTVFHSFYTSRLRPGTRGQSYDVNRRAALAALGTGSNRAGFVRFAGVMNMPMPPLYDSWENHFEGLSDVLGTVFEESAQQAIQKHRKRIGAAENDVIDVAISFDGTWARRGFSSLYGVQAVVLDGCVIDFNVFSSFCKSCQKMDELGIDKNSPAYEEWPVKHERKCRKNYSGSAKAMETKGAEVLFSRSIDKHKLRYTTFIGDGDSSSFDAIKNVYGDEHPVRKLDCVGHVHKRMGARLRNWISNNKKIVMDDGGNATGRNRLTHAAIDHLSSNYGYAIKSNAGNVEEMKKGVMAALYHSVVPFLMVSQHSPSPGHSFDHGPICCPQTAEDQHQFCPDGPSSWCWWKRSEAGEQAVQRSRPLPHAFFHELRPIFDNLSSERLLESCKEGLTQNDNESFHNTLWTYAPKAKYRGHILITTAARLAACQLHHGCKAFVRALEVTRTLGGKHSLSAFQSLDDARITASKLKASSLGKKARNKRKKWKKQRKDRQERQEGPTYNPGAFGPGDGEQPEGAEGRGRGRGRGTRGRGKGKEPTRGAGRGRGQRSGKSSISRKKKESRMEIQSDSSESEAESEAESGCEEDSEDDYRSSNAPRAKRSARQQQILVRSLFQKLNDEAKKKINSGPPAVVELEPFDTIESNDSSDSDEEFIGFHQNDLDDEFGRFMGPFLGMGDEGGK